MKTQLFDSLVEVHGKIQTALTGKKKAAQLYGKLPELKKSLDHSYADEMMLSEDARAETILAESDFLEKQASLLQNLAENQKHIQSEHTQAVPKLESNLKSLSQVQIQQQDDMAKLSEETRRLLTAYNNVVMLLSKQFVLWDEHLSQLEMQSKGKK